jgi:hypothetical protein
MESVLQENPHPAWLSYSGSLRMTFSLSLSLAKEGFSSGTLGKSYEPLQLLRQAT